jgi:hypothetical protein
MMSNGGGGGDVRAVSGDVRAVSGGAGGAVGSRHGGVEAVSEACDIMTGGGGSGGGAVLGGDGPAVLPLVLTYDGTEQRPLYRFTIGYNSE